MPRKSASGRLKAEIGDRPGESPANLLPATADSATHTREVVQLLKPHHHQGRDYAAGAVLDVSARTAAWLRVQGVVA